MGYELVTYTLVFQSQLNLGGSKIPQQKKQKSS